MLNGDSAHSPPPPSSPPGSLRVGRLITYAVAGSGLVLGGTIVYANYDPVFKNRLDQYVPGFASLSDSAADTYVALVDSVGLGRKRGDHEREKVGLGLEKKDVHLGSVTGERRKGKVKEKVPTSPPVEKVSGKTEQQVAPPEREETAPAPAPAHGGTTDTVAAKEEKEEGREKEAQEQVEEIPAQPSPVVPSPSPPPSSPSLTAEGEQAEEEKASQVAVKEEAAEQKEEAGKEKEKGEERAKEEVKVEEVEAQCMYLMCLLHRDGSVCNSLNVLHVCALH